jgi:hypothetical protein
MKKGRAKPAAGTGLQDYDWLYIEDRDDLPINRLRSRPQKSRPKAAIVTIEPVCP